MSRTKNLNFLVFLAILLSAFIVTIILFFNNDFSNYWMINLLPLSFVSVLLINSNILTKITSNVSVLLIVGCYYMRMVILPIFYVLSDYSSFTLDANYILYITKAGLLMIYEFFAIMFFSNIYLKRCEKKETEIKKLNMDSVCKKRKILYKIVIILIIVLVGFLFYPQFKSYFRLIFNDDLTAINTHNANFKIMKSTIPGVIYRIIVFFINILQVLIPIALIKKIYTLKIGSGKKFIFSLLIIPIIVSICTPDTATSFIIALTIIIMLIQLYPERKKVLFIGALSVGIPILFYALFIKTGVNSATNGVSSVLQAYFSGISNIATSFLMPNIPNIKMLFNDILTSIPFLNYFFQNYTTTAQLFNYSLYGMVGSHSQIIPMISQSLYYFGVVLAPLIPVLSILSSLSFEKKYQESEDIYNKFLYLIMSIYFAIAPILYNFTILILIFLQMYIPCKIIVNFNLKKK